MDIHRCRFVPYPPHAINSVAFSRPSEIQKRCPSDQRLAIGRADGSLELWNPSNGLWSQESVFSGGKDRSIEGLAWTQDFSEESTPDGHRGDGKLRLFSIGNSTVVTEWDLARGTPARHAQGNFGTIWCFAAQPGPKQQASTNSKESTDDIIRPAQYLAAGCEDGTIVLFSTEEQDLRYLKTIGTPPTKKPRVLSITWKDSNTVVAGYSDSTIRVYDIRNKENIRNMSLDKSAKGASETLVWAVHCLPNGTILSGDSTGELKVWDSNNYSLVQKLHCHLADVLDITSTANGDMIITGGADRRTVAYHPVPAEKGQRSGRWAEVMHRRFHEHDVKCLASFEAHDMSVVASGGLDTVPVMIPLRGWQKEYHRKLSNLPRSSPVSSAPRTRLFMSWWERQVSIWHLPRHDQVTKPQTSTENQRLVAEIKLVGEQNITYAQLSADGKYLAVTTGACVKVFRLNLRPTTSGQQILRVRKLDVPESLSRFGARLVSFSSDSQWLCCIRASNEIVLTSIVTSPDSKKTSFSKIVTLNRSPLKDPSKLQESGLGDYTRTINNIAFSDDGRRLAVGDIAGHISTWVLEGPSHENESTVARVQSSSSDASSSSEHSDDSSDDEDDSPSIDGQRWRKNPIAPELPSLDAPLLTMSFRPRAPGSHPANASSEVGAPSTRLTTRTHSHDQPTGEDRLVAVTSEHKIVEFRVQQGILSDWSRRNPASYLPADFQKQRERAMGTFWDISDTHERLWIYGSTWIFMIDMAQDLPMEATIGTVADQKALQTQGTAKQKRKREDEESEAERLRTLGSGAGGIKPLSESYTGLERPVQDSDKPQSEVLRKGKSTALAELRRGNNKQKSGLQQGNGVTTHQTTGAQASEATQATVVSKPTSHLLNEYRSILGVAVIGGGADAREAQKDINGEMSASQNRLEIAIIERPLWDVELPPRFDGGQDWEV